MLKMLFACLAGILFFCAINNPYRYGSIPGFLSESLAVGSGLILFAFVVVGVSVWRVPKMIMPIAWIAMIPVVQWCFGQIDFMQDMLFSVLYILGFFLVVLASYQLSLTSRQFVQYAAWALVLTGAVAGGIAILQWLGIKHEGILRMVGSRPYANMGQPNHLATLLMCCLMGLLYLYEKQKIKSIFALFLAGVFIFVLALAQSRTTWISSILIVLFLIFHRWQGNLRTSMPVLLGGLAYYWAGLWLPSWIKSLLAQHTQIEAVNSISGLARASGGMERLIMWKQSWAAIEYHPFVGYGWYQTTAGQYVASLDIPVKIWYNSAHNIILDLLIWNGVIFGGIIILYAIYLIARLILAAYRPESITMSMAVLAITIHALLEYPLFYSYLLIIFAVAIGIALSDCKIRAYSTNKIQPMILGGIFTVIFTVVVTQYLYWYHAKAERRLQLAYNPIYVLDKLTAKMQWDYKNTLSAATPQQLAQGEKITRHYLTAVTLKRYAQYLAYNGKTAEAEHHLKILKVMYGQEISIEQLLQQPIK